MTRGGGAQGTARTSPTPGHYFGIELCQWAAGGALLLLQLAAKTEDHHHHHGHLGAQIKNPFPSPPPPRAGGTWVLGSSGHLWGVEDSTVGVMS